MSISIAICELDAKDSLCKDKKKAIYKVRVKDTQGFGDAIEYTEFVPIEDAKKAVGDIAEFMKRNKLRVEPTEIYLNKVKDEGDLAKLSKLVVKKPTGWVFMSKLDDSGKKKALSLSDEYNRVSEWDRIEQEEANAICAKCKCSWDKGRGCMGDFGPSNSMIPVFAKKFGCDILANIVDSAEKEKKFTPADAKELIKEVDILVEKIPNEEKGKLYMNRYKGVLERLKEMAKVSIDQDCGFYFI